MDLRQKIVEMRISSMDQLSTEEQILAKSDAELAALISENRRFVTNPPSFGPAPDKHRMLDLAYDRAGKSKEYSMSMISRLFTNSPVPLRAAFAVVLLVAVAVGSVLLLPRSASWAAVSGYALVFDLGPVNDLDEGCKEGSDIRIKLDQLNDAVMDWRNGFSTDGEGEGTKLTIFLSASVENGRLEAVVGFVDGTQELLDSLKAALADVPELPEPQVTDGTWFNEKGCEPCSMDGGIVVTIFNHRFSFPTGTDSATAEKQINEWLAENKPELKAQVEIEDVNGAIQVRIKLTEKE